MWGCTGPILKITPVPKTHSPIERRQTVTIQSQQPARRTYLYLRHSHPLRQRNTSARAFHFCWKSRSHIRADLKLCVATSHFCHPDWQQVIAEFWRAWRTPLLRTHVAWCRCIAHSWGKNKSYSCMLVSLKMVRKIFFFRQVQPGWAFPGLWSISLFGFLIVCRQYSSPMTKHRTWDYELYCFCFVFFFFCKSGMKLMREFIFVQFCNLGESPLCLFASLFVCFPSCVLQETQILWIFNQNTIVISRIGLQAKHIQCAVLIYVSNLVLVVSRKRCKSIKNLINKSQIM